MGKTRHWLVPNPLTMGEAADIHKEARVHKSIARRWDARGEKEGAQYYYGIAEGMDDTANQYREHFKPGKGGRKNPMDIYRSVYWIHPKTLQPGLTHIYISPRKKGTRTLCGLLIPSRGGVFYEQGMAGDCVKCRQRIGLHLIPGENPYFMRKLPLQKKYRVYSRKDGLKIHAKGTTKQKAAAQVRILKQAKSNPPGATLIYSRVISIVASKAGMKHKCDAKCKAANHVYRHVHIRQSSLWGLPDGRLMIAEAK